MNKHTPISSFTDTSVQNRIEWIFKVISNYSVLSVVNLAKRVLNVPKSSQMHDIKSMPWITLLLVKFALRNNTSSLVRAPSMPGVTFDLLRNELWQLIGDSSLSGSNLQASLRSYLPVQIEFQIARPSSAIRWAMLISRLPIEAPASRMFADVFQLSPENYIDAIEFLSCLVDLGGNYIPKSTIEKLPDQLRNPLHRIVALLSKNLLDLRIELQKGISNEFPQKWELNQIPFAARFPLFETENGDWFVWHTRMLNRALEELQHQQLMQTKGDEYLKVFTRLFEDYVIQLSQEIHPNLITEISWKKKMGHNASAVEAIIPEEGVNIFIEAKMAYNHDAIILDKEPNRLVTRLERVTDALYQARRVSQRLRTEAYKYPKRANAHEEFLIIVTSRELYIGNGIKLKELLPLGAIDFDDSDVNQRMPLKNIFIMSIDDFERLQAAVLNSKICLLSQLRSVAALNENPATASLFFSAQLRKDLGANLDFTGLVKETRSASQKRILPLLKTVTKKTSK